MDPDLFLVIGVLSAALALPALMSAYSEGRPPRAALLLIVIAGGSIVYAYSANPMGYSLQDLPAVFGRVLGRLLN